MARQTKSLLLDNFINKRKCLRPYTIIRKAFDTATCETIQKALNRMGTESHMLSYIMNDLRNSTTEVKVGTEYTRAIKLNGEVKQDDFLSPEYIGEWKPK